MITLDNAVINISHFFFSAQRLALIISLIYHFSSLI